MPYAHKTSQPTKNALRKGDLAFAVDGEQNLGPTSITGYYNTLHPPIDGYAIYSLGINNNPIVMTVTTDDEVIRAANTLGGNVSTKSDALSYLANRSSTWVLRNMPNNMVTDQLVLRLNAASISSYPESGTDWFDLSGLENNGVIKRANQFNASGYFEYAGNAQNDESSVTTVEVNTNLTEGNTVEQWIYHDSRDGNGNMPFTWWNQSWDLWAYNNYFGINNGSSLVYGITNADDILIGKWNHVVTFFPNNWSTRYQDAKMWINGVSQTMAIQQGSLSNKSLSSSQTVGIGGGYTSGGDNFNWNGRVASTSIYAKELSDSEVLQNYYGAPDVPNNSKIILNRTQEGVSINSNGWGIDLAKEYDNLQTYGYLNSDLNGDFDGLTNFTYFLWLHCYSHHTSYSQSPFYKYNGTTTAVVRLYDFGDYNGNGAQKRNRFYANRNGSWGSISDNFDMDVGETACICLQYDSNGGDLWKNGIKTGTNVGGGTIATNTSTFGIITPEYGGEQYLKVKEAYIYTNTLTDSQIEELYSATKMKYNV